MEQLSMEGGVPLDATEGQIEARISDVADAFRKDLTARGIAPPYIAPPLPTRFGEYLKIARYSDDGLRIVVLTVLDVESKPWFIGVRCDAFLPESSVAEVE